MTEQINGQIPEPEYKLEMKDICKSFGGVHALKNVCLNIKKGEIHALLGENGAGKSTLMKILSGAYQLDSGQVLIDGSAVNVHNPKDGVNLGISVIYQELALMPDLSVEENIYIDNLNDGKGIINFKRLRDNARKVLDDLGFTQIPVNKEVSELSVAYQQVVEISKALSRNSSILVLDEPTAVLSTKEAQQLFELLIKLKNDGVTIVYISHRMEEIYQICDRATVLKDGENVATVNIKDIDEKNLVNLMIGRDLKDYFPSRESKIGDVVLEVENIKRGNVVNDVSFKVHEGEVFGIAGLVGAGRTETMMAIFGGDKRDGGTIKLSGKPVDIRTPIDALKAGISLLPEDRKTSGVLLNLPILHNISISCLKKLSRWGGIINRKQELDTANDMVKKLRIKIGSVYNDCSSLSGGNQQKVSISKLLGAGSRVLLFDEPTRGVDVGAKIEIYKIINELVGEGYAVIMVSSEMPEVIGMCDRVAVMRGGSIVGELQRDELSEENLIKYAMGVN